MRSSRSKPDPLDPGPAGFAHRGVHFGSAVPENSLAAFTAAIELGAGIECDVRLSGSGSAVVVHDSNLKRVCGLPLDVEQSPAVLLAEQRLGGSGECIPALSQVLQLVRGRVPLLLELKTRNRNAARLCREVLGEIAPEDGAIGIMSFDPTVGQWFRRNRKQIRRGLVIGKDTPPLKRWLAMTIAAPHFIAVHCELLGSRWAARIGKRIPVYSWTIRTGEQRAQAGVHADALIWEGDGRPRI